MKSKVRVGHRLERVLIRHLSCQVGQEGVGRETVRRVLDRRLCPGRREVGNFSFDAEGYL
jgi:hypothetical protein